MLNESLPGLILNLVLLCVTSQLRGLQVDYAPSYRVGNGLDDHRKMKKRKKESNPSGYTSWKDAEPLSTDDGLGLGGLDDYLIGQDIEEDYEDVIYDEDELTL